MAGALVPMEASGASSRRPATCGTRWSWKDSGASWMPAGVRGPWIQRGGCSCPGETHHHPAPWLETHPSTQTDKVQHGLGDGQPKPSGRPHKDQICQTLSPHFKFTPICSPLSKVDPRGPRAKRDPLWGLNTYLQVPYSLIQGGNFSGDNSPIVSLSLFQIYFNPW